MIDEQLPDDSRRAAACFAGFLCGLVRLNAWWAFAQGMAEFVPELSPITSSFFQCPGYLLKHESLGDRS